MLKLLKSKSKLQKAKNVPNFNYLIFANELIVLNPIRLL